MRGRDETVLLRGDVYAQAPPGREAMLHLLWVPLVLPFLLLGTALVLGRVERAVLDRAAPSGRPAPRPGPRHAGWARPAAPRRPATVAAAEDVARVA